MSLDTEKEIIRVYEPLKTANAKCIVDSDIIVPDTKPDILNILEVTALACTNEKYVKKDKLCISGTVDYNILYAGGEDTTEVRNIRYKVPFTEQIEIPGAGEGMDCFLSCRVAHKEAKIRNSRKISIKAVVEFIGGISSQKSVFAVSEIQSTSKIPALKKSISVLDMAVCEQNVFSVNDEYRLPEHSDDVDEILKTNIKVKLKETKAMNNKLVLKGTLETDTLYTADGELYHIENETPFTEVMDADGLTDEMHTEINISVHSGEVSLSKSEADTCILLDAEVDVVVKGYCEKTHSVVVDAYSPDYAIEVTKEKQKFYKTKDVFKENLSLTETMSLDDSAPGIIKVYNVIADAVTEEIIPKDGYATVNGYLDATVLYLSESGSYPVYCANKKLPFSFQISSVSIDSLSVADADATLIHCGYVLKSQRDIELRATLCLEGKILSEESVEFVSDIVLGEETPIAKKDQPGIVIYFADKGENIWDIAKRYNTTVEEIASVNSLEPDAALLDRQQLLIPKRVIV